MKVLVGVCLVLLAICGAMAIELKRTNETLGAQSLAIQRAAQDAIDAKAVYGAVLDGKETLIQQMRRAHELSQAEIHGSIERERQAQERVYRAEKALREAIRNDHESVPWGGDLVPDAVIDRLYDAATTAVSGSNL